MKVLDRFVRVPKTLNPKDHSDFKAIYRDIYFGIMLHVGTSPASDNWPRAWPSIDRIAKMAGRSRRAVMDGLPWLEDHAYLYRQRRPRKSTVYTLILDQEQFIEITRREGRSAAIRDNERLITERRGNARRENARQSPAFGQKRRPVHPNSGTDRDPMQAGALQGVHHGSGAAGRTRTRSNGFEERDPRERNGVTTAPPTTPEKESKEEHNDNNNGQGKRTPTQFPTREEKQEYLEQAKAAFRGIPNAEPMTDAEFESRIRALRRHVAGWK